MSNRIHWPSALRDVVLAGTMIFAFSAWQHMPGIIGGAQYADVTSVYYRTGIGRGPHQIPYVDYVFEYPIPIGLLVYGASYLATAYTSDFNLAIARYTLLMDLALYAFTFGTIVVLYRLVVALRREEGRIWKYLLIMPSFLMFTVYNWDIMAIFFSVYSLLLFLREQRSKSAIAMGLGISTKLYPLVLLPALLAELQTWRDRLRFAFMSAMTVLLVNLPFMIWNFKTWFGTWTYHLGWGIEDSWLIFFFKQLDPAAHYVSAAILAYLVYKVLWQSRSGRFSNPPDRLITRCLMLSLSWLLASYVAPPQMALIPLPFFVLSSWLPLAPIYLADTLNAFIIVFWFNEMSAGRNPISADDYVQWFSLARQIIWLGILLYCMYPDGVKGLTKHLLRPISERSSGH